MKDSLKRKKRQDTYGEKIFTNYIADKGQIAGIYKECSKKKSGKNQTIQLESGQKIGTNILLKGINTWQINI